MSLTFQRSFKLELDNVAKIMDAVVEIPNASRHEIADFTGIPIGKNEIHGKVDPTLIYASYCGLIAATAENNNKQRRLTSFGRIVYGKDKRLRRNETRWAIHYHLSSITKGAPAWAFFVHRFLPGYSQFSREDLNQGLKEAFPELSDRYINENERTLLQCYTEYGALGKMQLVETYQKDNYLCGGANYPNIYLTGYLLAEIWESIHPDKSMVAPEILFDCGHLATTLRLSDGDLQVMLDNLSAAGVVRQMREAPPFQVVRKWNDKFELLERAYEDA